MPDVDFTNTSDEYWRGMPHDHDKPPVKKKNTNLNQLEGECHHNSTSDK